MSLGLARPYDHRRWRKLAKQQLQNNPLCVMCLQVGQVTPADAVDHVEPHRGDPKLFWFGALQSLCARHHNSTKRQLDNRGYYRDIGLDGWPLDMNHPVHRAEQKQKLRLKNPGGRGDIS